MRYPWVTIVVLNFNGISDTRLCIKSLLKTVYPHIRIFIVDNGSTVNEASILKKEFVDKRLTFVRFSRNRGYSGGNNLFMKRTKDTYIALINNDVEVKSNWLTPIIAMMENNKEIAVVQPKILWTRNKRYFDYAGAAGGYIDFLGYPFTKGRVFTTLEADNGKYNTPADIFWASGAAIVMRSRVLQQVGVFDETFFNYMEEIDLCYRIHQAGYKLVYQPKAVVYHKVASSASHNSTKKRFFEHRNNLLLVLKNFPRRKLIYVIPVRFFLEGLSFVYYLAIGRMDFAWSVLGSLLSFIFLMPRYLSERKSHNHVDTPAMKKLIYPASIVFAYFVMKKKTFSQVKKFARWRPE